MSLAQEDMISSILEELGISGAEGISISQLSKNLDVRLSLASQAPSGDCSTKNQLWKALVAREDVLVGDQTPLESSTLQKLALDEVIALGLGERKIQIRTDAAAEDATRMHTSQNAFGESTEASPAMEAAQIQPARQTKAISSPQSSPTKTPSRSRTWIRKSMFTPQEELDRQEDEMQRQAGVSRVYINPSGSTRAKVHYRGQQRKTMIAVFKSEKLSDPQWLESRKGSWIETYLERTSGFVARLTQDIEESNFPSPGRTPRKRKAAEGPASDANCGEDKFSKKRRVRSPNDAQLAGHLLDQEMTTAKSSIVDNAAKFGSKAQKPYQSPFTPQDQPPLQQHQDSQCSNPNAQSTQGPYDQPFPRGSIHPQTGFEQVADANHPCQGDSPQQGHTQSPPRTQDERLQALREAETQPHSYRHGYTAVVQLQRNPSISKEYKSPYSTSGIPASLSAPTLLTQSKTATESHPATDLTYSHPDNNLVSSSTLKSTSNPSSQAGYPLPRSQLIPRPRDISPPIVRNSTDEDTTSYVSPFRTQYIDTYAGQHRPYNSPYATMHASSTKDLLQSQQAVSSSEQPQGPRHRYFLTPHAQLDFFIPTSSNSNSSPFRKSSVSFNHSSLVTPNLSLEEIQELEEKHENQLSAAEGISISNVVARVAAAYNNVVGNLILSGDKSKLMFLQPDQDQSQTPYLLIHVSRIIENPITSMPGSKPMELRLKSIDENGAEMIHRFNFGQTTVAYQAANNMRAKLVLARIVSRVASGQKDNLFEENNISHIELVKPHKCEKCGARFKNKEGIKYHQSKSNTSCNPNFDILKRKARRIPPQTKSTRKKMKKKTVVDSLPTTSENYFPIESVEDQDSSESKSSSEDSVIAWAEGVAGLRPSYSARSLAPLTGKKFQSESSAQQFERVENEVLQEIMEEYIKSLPAQERPSAETAISGQIDTLNPNRTATREEISSQRSKDIIFGLVEENYGIFPSGNSLWFAFVAVWLKKYARSETMPQFKLCRKALDQLVEEKKLVTITFSFRDKDLTAKDYEIIALLNIDPTSPLVEKLKELIQVVHPTYYVPSRFAPPDTILTKLHSITHGLPTESTQYSDTEDGRVAWKRRGRNSKLVAESRRRSNSPASSTGDVYTDDDGVHSSDDELQSDDTDGDESYRDGPATLSRHKWIDMEAYEAATTREKRALRMKARWSAAKASGSNALTQPGNYAPVVSKWKSRHKLPDTRKPGHGWKGPLTEDEKKRRAAQATLRLQSWNQAPTFLPNPQTGAWDQTPVRVKATRNLQRRPQLPEPITFIQAENGAWSVRPYGHGVRPIYARPSRRADGNPFQGVYLEKIENGFRPVLMPTKKRLFLPAMPSKRLLRDPTSYGTLQDLEISPITGKPKKPYGKRKPASASRKDQATQFQQTAKTKNPKLKKIKSPTPFSKAADLDFSNTGFPKRMTRNSIRATQDLDEIQMLHFFEPRKVSVLDGPRNPGLESMPARFGLVPPSRIEAVEPNFSQNQNSSDIMGNDLLNNVLRPAFSFQDILLQIGGNLGVPSSQSDPILKGFEQVAEWEQGPALQLLSSGTLEPGYRWINHTIDFLECSFDTETVKLRWLDNATFTVENLPYKDLDEAEDTEPLQVSELPKHQIPKSSLKPAIRDGRDLREVQRNLCTRRHTALRTDFQGVLDDVNTAPLEFGVELANHTVTPRRRHKDGALSDEDEIRFLVTCIVIRTLVGGLAETMDWVLVASLFPKFTLNYLNKTWTPLLQKKRALIEKLTLDFQEAFLPAYESGEIPSIDYDRLVDFNWASLVDWAIKRVYVTTGSKSIPLPDSRDRLKKFYTVTEQDPEEAKLRETYFSVNNPVYRRIEAISSIPYTVPAIPELLPHSAQYIEINNLTLAKSWARAIVLTPAESYDANAAAEKVKVLGDSLIKEAIEVLLKDRVIMHRAKGRAVPGRSYEPTDTFSSALRKHVTDKLFVEAIQFKKFLDAEFAKGMDCVKSPYMANEGALMCITNLQAYGRIKLQGVGVPMNKFGLTDGGYETRKLPKDKFRFNMDIYPTSSYVFDSDNRVLQNFGKQEPPKGGANGEIPLWYGITNILIPEVWKKVLVAVAGSMALRSGSNISVLESAFRPALEEWEIWRLLEWGVKVGLFERLNDAVEGWTTGEWYWAVVGGVCAAHIAES